MTDRASSSQENIEAGVPDTMTYGFVRRSMRVSFLWMPTIYVQPRVLFHCQNVLLLFGAVNFLALQTHHFSELRSSQASALKSALPLFPVLALYLWCARVGVLLGQ